jgi:hypothetical protein
MAVPVFKEEVKFELDIIALELSSNVKKTFSNVQPEIVPPAQ